MTDGSVVVGVSLGLDLYEDGMLLTAKGAELAQKDSKKGLEQGASRDVWEWLL